MNLTKKEVYSLLKDWCDYMLDRTVEGIEDPNLKGAMLCPACGFVHGRFADSVLAYTLLYTKTGEEKYLNIRVFTENQKREAYERQNGICSKCGKQFQLNEMDDAPYKTFHLPYEISDFRRYPVERQYPNVR